MGQRIFQQPFSWKSLGVDMRGRSGMLRVNCREALRQRKATPAQIAREAQAAGVWTTMQPYLMALTSDA